MQGHSALQGLQSGSDPLTLLALQDEGGDGDPERDAPGHKIGEKEEEERVEKT